MNEVLVMCATALLIAAVAWDYGRRSIAAQGNRDALRELDKKHSAALDHAERLVDQSEADLLKRIDELVDRLEETEGDLKRRGEQVDSLRFAQGARAQNLQPMNLSHRNRGARGQAPGG